MLADAIFTVLTASFVVSLAVRRRSPDQVVVEVLVLGAVSGILVQMLDLAGVAMHHNGIRNVGAAVCIIGLVNEYTRPRRAQEGRLWPRWAFVLGPSAVVAALVVVSRLNAHGQQSYALTNIHFFGGEDNAKWVNTISQLVTGRHVDVGNIGGVCASYLSFVLSWCRTLSPLFGFVTNQVSLLVTTMVMSELALVVLVPIALAPLVRMVAGDRDLLVLLPVHGVAALFLVSCSDQFMQAGHLSAQLVVVFGVATLLHTMLDVGDDVRDPARMLVGLVLVAGLTSTWLPLQMLTVGVPVLMLVVAARWRMSGGGLRGQLRPLVACAAVTPGAFLIARNTWVYVSHTDTTAQNLFAATGYTPSHTTFIITLALVLVALVAVVPSMPSWDGPRPSLLPVSLMVLPLTAILMSDRLRTGKLNYGSLKVVFIVLTVVSGSLLVPAVVAVLRFVRQDARRAVAGALGAALLLVLTIEGSLLPWLDVTKQSQWRPKEAVLSSPWAQFTLVKDVDTQNLSDLPVACGIKTDKEDVLAVDYNTYTCTRFLTAMGGLESEAGPLVEWQVRTDWDKSVGYLRALPDVVLRKKIIRLDATGQFVDMVTLGSLLGSD